MQASRGYSEPRLGRPAGFYAVRNRPPIFSAAAMATFPSLMAAVLRHVSMAARAKSRSIGADVRKAPRELIGAEVSARTVPACSDAAQTCSAPETVGDLGERQLIRSCLIRTVRFTKSRCRTISAGTRSLDFRREQPRKCGLQKIGARTSASTRPRTPLRDNEAAAQWLRQHHGGPRYLAARMIDIGHKLIEASTFIAHGKWLPSLRAHREAASSFDTINDALCRTADAARCWEVNPSIYNDRRLTQLVERAQDAFAQAYPATDTTLRLLQQMTPDGLQLALIRCEDSGSPLIAISIDADRWRQAARLDRASCFSSLRTH
jgi:hypothetical protein